MIGFGKAGKAVASVILQHPDMELVWVLRRSDVLEKRSVAEFLGVSPATGTDATIHSIEHVDIEQFLDEYPVDGIIDFSPASGIYTYGRAAARRGITIISAVSHYAEAEKELLAELARETVVFWSPNITLGVNYLLFAGKFLKKIAPWADIEVVEEHFKQKQGVSGTALKIAEALEVNISDINSVRAGGIVGRHEVIFGFPYQTVRLIHESISREAFGNGVIFAAQNLKGLANGLYDFEDILLPYFSTGKN
ncbi:4-hydroxy-tetrahydrodipicolinate reductase [Nemorincola caseinilytica]|uniref:4-hydroxy-tetrahydrodipicolinate reductase n=1 Tax=Nemorincola caseinilytica TaxID=2054315 RepID=A0ABP8NMF1_9BACT